MKRIIQSNFGRHFSFGKFFKYMRGNTKFHHIFFKRGDKKYRTKHGEILMANKDIESTQKVFNIQGYAEDFLFSYMNTNFIFNALKESGTVFYEQKSKIVHNFEELCTKLKSELNLRLVFLNERDKIRWYIGEDIYVGIDKSEFSESINFAVLTTQQKLKDKFVEILTPYIKEEKKSKLIHMLCPNEYGSGETFYPVGEAGTPIEKNNYETNVVSDFEYAVSELNSNIPAGRLLIIDGPPGTGKSYFIRGILNEIKFATCVLLPASMIQGLDKPTIIPVLLKERQEKKTSKNGVESTQPIVVIIEDADDCLVPRGSDNMSAVSSLLNYTDGIFGSLFDLRIIATTNAKHFQMEKALSRSGRLLKRIHIDLLSQGRAEDVYERLTGKRCQIKKPISLADVYAKSKNVPVPEQKEDSESKLGFN